MQEETTGASQPTPPVSWSHTRRGRKELLAVAVFCLVNILTPLVFVDLYPFTRAPMFSDAPRCYCNYEVLRPDGAPLSEAEFGLQRNYWGNPVGIGVGFRPPPTIDEFGEVADPSTITRRVKTHLARFPELPYVDVVQEVVAPIEGGNVGVTTRNRLRIANPHFVKRRSR